MVRTNDSLRDQERNKAPMIEIFGGVFALLMVLFLLLNLFVQASLMERLETFSEEGLYKVGWGKHGSGYVVITFPDELRIIETGEAIEKDKICLPDSAFIRYAHKVYNSKKNQLVFTLLEGSVNTMAKARNCMQRIMPDRSITIGWIIANEELLKSVSLDDIPAYIDKAIE